MRPFLTLLVAAAGIYILRFVYKSVRDVIIQERKVVFSY